MVFYAAENRIFVSCVLNNTHLTNVMADFDNRDQQEIISKRVRAGKRTYFFDVRTTRSEDFYLTITESKKR